MCPFRGENYRMAIDEEDFLVDEDPSAMENSDDSDISSDSDVSSEDMLSVGSSDDDDDEDDENDSMNDDEEEEPAENLRLDVDLGELAEGREDETDDNAVIQAILRSRHHKSNHPPTINEQDTVSDISFHPSADIIAVGTYTGDIRLYEYSNTENKLASEHEVHLEACRHIEFDSEGDLIYSCSKDKSISITDVNTGRLVANYDNAHNDPLYSLHLWNENLFVSGCEGGYVKLWDRRQKESVFSLQLMEDQVNSMISDNEKRMLVATCGGCIHAINLRQRKLKAQSEEYTHDLTSMAFIRDDSKLLVGSSKGIFYVFNWGDFGYHEDEFPGKHPINQMLGVTENIAVIACEDGAIRATYTYPHRFLGVVGQHDFGIDSLDINHSGKIIASAAGDTAVKFWNISYLAEVEVATVKTNKAKDLKNNLPSSEQANRGSFFADMNAADDAADDANASGANASGANASGANASASGANASGSKDDN